MITISDRGAEKVREFLAGQEGDVGLAGLRVGVRGGGCSGFQYQLAFDAQKPGDQVTEKGGVKLLVDPKSFLYLNGAEIDFVDGLMGAGFSLKNPNARGTCGCGQSFQA